MLTIYYLLDIKEHSLWTYQYSKYKQTDIQSIVLICCSVFCTHTTAYVNKQNINENVRNFIIVHH